MTFDEDLYERAARLYPALLALLPLFALVILLYAPEARAVPGDRCSLLWRFVSDDESVSYGNKSENTEIDATDRSGALVVTSKAVLYDCAELLTKEGLNLKVL